MSIRVQWLYYKEFYAHSADPETYSATSRRMKAKIREEIRKGGRLP